MSEGGIEVAGGQMKDFDIDQLAASVALMLGAVGSLLLVVWQSRCLCRLRLGCSDTCYVFDCERQPPPVDPEKTEDEAAKNRPAEEPDAAPEPLVPPEKPTLRAEPEPEPEAARP